jgi:hypothetical protein
MPAKPSDKTSVARLFQELFDDSSLRLRSCESVGNVPSYRAEAHSQIGELRLRLRWLRTVSRARLLDAIASIRLTDRGDRGILDILVAQYLSPSRQHLLRDAGIPFADLAGNAWVVTHGVHIDRRGFANPKSEDRSSRDPFSDKASLVTRVLFGEPEPLGVRNIAEKVDLTPGYVSKIATELERRGYLAKSADGLRLRHADELLSDWVVAYRRRKPRSAESLFWPARQAREAMSDLAAAFDRIGVDYLFGGMAGASLVDPHAEFDVVDILVKDADAGASVVRDLGARAVDRGGNISVIVPYYRVSAFYGAQRVGGHMRVASDLQLYLDVHDYPVRGREQAEHLYERRLRAIAERAGRE